MARIRRARPEPTPQVQELIIPRSPAPVPQTQPQGQPAYSPPPTPVIYRVPGYAQNQRPLMIAKPIPQTCSLVKPGDADPYADMMSSLPDIAELNGIQPSGFDAMELTGHPQGAAMEKWTPTARYYNGKTDVTANRTLDQHVSTIPANSDGTGSMSVASVRASSGSVRGK